MKFLVVCLAITLSQFNNCGASVVGVVTINDNPDLNVNSPVTVVQNLLENAKDATKLSDILQLTQSTFANQAVQDFMGTVEIKDLMKFVLQLVHAAKNTDVAKQLKTNLDKHLQTGDFKNSLVNYLMKVKDYLNEIIETSKVTNDNAAAYVYIANPLTNDGLKVPIPVQVIDVGSNTINAMINYLSKY